jgi:4-amino-4-deoxy-L-arabinose transferase-like glycosyltransferase
MAFDTMTEPPLPPRNPGHTNWTERLALLAILVVAAWLRIDGIAFGMPALNDPDEPLFMMTALDMLRSGNPNPGWFGHPATLTFYALALVVLAVGGTGIASGRYADADAFVGAVYADPSILFVPARLFFAACGVLCVWLTWRLGKRLGGTRLGLIAAALLAVNSVHVEYSQLIRTDVQASVFVLLATLAALDIRERGRLRDHLTAGIFVGLGMATKWPAALVVLNPLVASLWRTPRGAMLRPIVLLGGASVATLLIASPFLVFDHAALLRNLTGEARPVHPGATGGGFLANLTWYVRGPLLEGFGWLGLPAAAAGMVLALRNREMRAAVLPFVVAMGIVICSQSLVWERWVVPLLPFAALAAAYAIGALADLLRARLGRRLPAFELIATAVILVPTIAAIHVAKTERANDTRQLAAAWVNAHVPQGSTILVEHAAFDLLQRGWRLRFPLGSAGCADAAALLAGRIRYSTVETLRVGRPIVDIGHVEPSRLASCRADYAVFTHYDVYRTDRDAFAAQLGAYRAIAAGGRVRAVIRPAAGSRGGPVVRIVELRRTSAR